MGCLGWRMGRGVGRGWWALLEEEWRLWLRYWGADGLEAMGLPGQFCCQGGSELEELLWLMSGRRAGENRYNSWVTLLGKLSQCIKHRLMSHRGTGDTQPSSQRILYVSLEQPTS